jgi:hypothetical protein
VGVGQLLIRLAPVLNAAVSFLPVVNAVPRRRSSVAGNPWSIGAPRRLPWDSVGSKGVPSRGTQYGAIRAIGPVQGADPHPWPRSRPVASIPLKQQGL